MQLRNDWTREEVQEIYNTPLMELIFRAATLHREWHDPSKMQICKLVSVKTGGCPEDCKYCNQSVYNPTGLKAQKLMQVDEVVKEAEMAKEKGCTRFCMSAAWRNVRNSNDFEHVLQMVREVKAKGLEVCVTLGMLTAEQAGRLKEAGVYAYNHNLDSGEKYYPQVATTRTYQDRLETLAHARKAGLTLCCGGIVGLGEKEEDRIDLLHTLCTLEVHPESVPINALIPIPGTRCENNKKVNWWEMARMIATARILMPSSHVRLTAGRKAMSTSEQALCYMAGANSIFIENCITTPLFTFDEDQEMLAILGLEPCSEVREI